MEYISNEKNETWLLLMHRIFTVSDSFRVETWRGLQKIGALQLKNLIHVLPASTDVGDSWLFSGFFQKPINSIFANSLLDIVIVLARHAQVSTCLRNIPLGLDKLANVHLSSDNILLLGHRTLRSG